MAAVSLPPGQRPDEHPDVLSPVFWRGQQATNRPSADTAGAAGSGMLVWKRAATLPVTRSRAITPPSGRAIANTRRRFMLKGRPGRNSSGLHPKATGIVLVNLPVDTS